MRFRTKVDTWLIVVLGAAIALPFAIAVYSGISAGLASPTSWLPLGIGILTLVFICIVGVPTEYSVESDRLVIRSGVLHWTVPLAAIVSITPSNSPLSSPAWSLDRLEVQSVQKGRSRSILISPQRAEEFLRAVSTREPRLVATDQGLRRTT